MFLDLACNFIKKETLAQVFSFEFCKISKNIFFTENLWATASVPLIFEHINCFFLSYLLCADLQCKYVCQSVSQIVSSRKFVLSFGKIKVRFWLFVHKFLVGLPRRLPMLRSYHLWMNLSIYIFYLGFLSRTFSNHRAAGEGGGHFFNSSLPLPPTSRALRH